MADKKQKPVAKTTYKYSMEEVCLSVLGVQRFYATILSKMVKTPSKSVGTIGVCFNTQGKVSLAYNEEFVLKQELPKAQGLIIHETLHIFLRHLTRFDFKLMKPEDRRLANWAMDMAINQYITSLPDGGFYPETFKLPREMNADFYFEELKKMRDEEKDKCPKCGTKMKMQKQEGDEEGDEDQKDKDSEGNQEGNQEGEQESEGKDKQGQGDKKVCPKCGHEEQEGQVDTGTHEHWVKVIDENTGELKGAAAELNIDQEAELESIILAERVRLRPMDSDWIQRDYLKE